MAGTRHLVTPMTKPLLLALVLVVPVLAQEPAQAPPPPPPFDVVDKQLIDAQMAAYQTFEDEATKLPSYAVSEKVKTATAAALNQKYGPKGFRYDPATRRLVNK